MHATYDNLLAVLCRVHISSFDNKIIKEEGSEKQLEEYNMKDYIVNVLGKIKIPHRIKEKKNLNRIYKL